MLRHTADLRLDTSGLWVKLGCDVLTCEQTAPLFKRDGLPLDAGHTDIVTRNVNAAHNAPYSEDNLPLRRQCSLFRRQPTTSLLQSWSEILSLYGRNRIQPFLAATSLLARIFMINVVFFKRYRLLNNRTQLSRKSYLLLLPFEEG